MKTCSPLPAQQPAPRAARQRLLPAAALVLALALAACASTPPPTAEMAVAGAAVAHATAAGAGEYAPIEMGQARDKLARANAALAARDHDTALTLAQQAQLDAQVAEARTETEKARRSAAALKDAGRALREEMARQPK